jgi:hypothetical protein
MKISEAISLLENIKREKGDLQVGSNDPEWGISYPAGVRVRGYAAEEKQYFNREGDGEFVDWYMSEED